MFTYIVYPFHYLLFSHLVLNSPLSNPISQYNSLPLKVTGTSGNLVWTSESASKLLFFMTKISKFFSPFPRKGWRTLFLLPFIVCKYWFSEARAISVAGQIHSHTLLGCLFSLSGWGYSPFISKGIPALGEGIEEAAGYLWQTLGEYESLWSVMAFSFVICFHGHSWVSGWETALYTLDTITSLRFNNLHCLPGAYRINK